MSSVTEPWEPSLEEYHSDPTAVSSTSLSAFREHPGLYHGRYIDRSIPFESLGKSVVIGSLIHAMVEGKKPIVATYRGAPVLKRNAKAFKDLQAEIGDLACTGPEFEAASGALDALNRAETPQAKLGKWLLLECPGEREYSHRWEHESGVQCKCRFDVLPDVDRGTPGVVHEFADLKVVNDPRLKVFTAISAKFDRHCQAGLYSMGYKDLRDEWPVVTYVVIGNAPPHAIKVCQLSESFIELGLSQVTSDLHELKVHRARDEWFDAEEVRSYVPTIEPPRWLYNQQQGES